MRNADTLAIPEGWKPVANPPSLFKRYEFAGYTQTREFLDRLSLISDESGIFPDLGFGKTHVNVTLRGEGGAMPAQPEIDYAARANTMVAADLP
jgi:pterin-4a-carbinolamine dehydratase